MNIPIETDASVLVLETAPLLRPLPRLLAKPLHIQRHSHDLATIRKTAILHQTSWTYHKISDQGNRRRGRRENLTWMMDDMENGTEGEGRKRKRKRKKIKGRARRGRRQREEIGDGDYEEAATTKRKRYQSIHQVGQRDQWQPSRAARRPSQRSEP